ncbi:MAG: IS5 family transposase [Thiolinea sp.]
MSEAEWNLIKPYLEPPTKRGSSFTHEKKQIVDAILYVLKGGITWRMMPNDFPPWQTAYDHFSRWNKRGVWEAALDAVNALRRRPVNKKVSPSSAIIDAQNVKTQYASEDRGIDGGKKVKGHKRHILVDTMGNLLHVSIHVANRSDTKAAGCVLARGTEKYPSIEAFSGDAGYSLHGWAISDDWRRILKSSPGLQKI